MLQLSKYFSKSQVLLYNSIFGDYDYSTFMFN